MSGKRAGDIRDMFGRIVPRYDLLNRLMSLGMDGGWRRHAALKAKPAGGRILDVGTGTGDLAFELTRRGASCVIGSDFSGAMLTAARSKANKRALSGIAWLLGDTLRLPFPNGTFDAVTNGFVLRNLADLRAGLSEMARVLKPEGRLVCLDMTHPRPGPAAALYRLYFHHLLPPVAGVISGNPRAYHYLPNSLIGFPNAPALAALLSEIGLRQVDFEYLAGGTVAVHSGLKPPAG